MKSAYAILVTLAFPALASANQEACVFQTYGLGTVQIKYDYKTEKGGSGSTFGSGFIVSGDGHIITANHVLEPDEDNPLVDGDKIVSDSLTITIGSLQGKVETAIIIKRDTDDDIALVKIPGASVAWQSLPIGESGGLRVGDRLTGLGFPKSDIAVLPEMPIISQNAKVHGVLKPWLQTALSLNKGDSGGPIFDSLGRVVGIAVAMRNDGAQLVSFIIPIQYAMPLIEQAGAKAVQYGSCAEFPSCRDQSHGIEKYGIDMPVSQWSEWRGGGYNRNAYCNDLLGGLQQKFPNAILTKIRDDEQNRRDGTLGSHVSYRYYCEFDRQEQPVFKLAAGPECLSKP